MNLLLINNKHEYKIIKITKEKLFENLDKYIPNDIVSVTNVDNGKHINLQSPDFMKTLYEFYVSLYTGINSKELFIKLKNMNTLPYDEFINLIKIVINKMKNKYIT